MSPFFYVVPFFFVLITIEFLLARRRGLDLYRLQDTVTSLNTGIVSQAVNVLGAGVSVYMYSLMVDAFGLFTWNTSSLWLWIVGLVLYDFCYYWVHRTGHEVNLFWAAHVIHHSSEDFNLATALRQSATGFWFKWAFYAPLAVLGVPLKMFIVLGLIDLLYQYWVHTQLVGRMGVLERFMVTPSNHRVHHGQNDYCIDRNYGGIFSVWDKMFGTYADERPDEKVIYGVRKPLRSWDPVWGNIHHFVLIARLVRGATGWRERLAHVFGPPRGPLQLAAVDEQPFDPAAFVPFATPAPRYMQVIGVCSTLLGTAALMAFYWLLPGMTLAQSLLYMAAMLGFFSLIGQLWLHPRVTAAAETARQ